MLFHLGITWNAENSYVESIWNACSSWSHKPLSGWFSSSNLALSWAVIKKNKKGIVNLTACHGNYSPEVMSQTVVSIWLFRIKYFSWLSFSLTHLSFHFWLQFPTKISRVWLPWHCSMTTSTGRMGKPSLWAGRTKPLGLTRRCYLTLGMPYLTLKSTMPTDSLMVTIIWLHLCFIQKGTWYYLKSRHLLLGLI